MKDMMITRLIAVATFALTVLSAIASPLTPVVKAGVKATEKAGAHVGGNAAVHGGAALAAATAKHEATKAVAQKTAGKIAENATPGRILAMGGATALVVGAHEMADGVQTVSESVGDTVRNNPEAARGIISDFFALPKSMVVMILIVSVAFLAWFFWPLIVLVRTWIRVVSSPRNCVIATATSAPTVESDKLTSPQNGSPGFTRIGVVWAVSGIVILTLLGIWRFAKTSERQTLAIRAETSAHDQKTGERLKSEYNGEVDRLYREFLLEVDSSVCNGFGHTRASIPNIVEKFGSVSHCASLVKAMVSDRLFGGDRVDVIMQQDLTPFYSKLYTARDNVSECVHRLAANLADANKAFALKLGKELETAEAIGDDEYKRRLQQWAEDVDKRIVDLTSGQLVAGISVAVEAVCVRETVATVAKLLGGIAVRQAGTMAASAGAATVDGPLPIGDIIGGVATIGCTLWSGWDVYQAAKVLPEKLAETLRSATDDCERQCREEAHRIGTNLVNQYCKKDF